MQLSKTIIDLFYDCSIITTYMYHGFFTIHMAKYASFLPQFDLIFIIILKKKLCLVSKRHHKSYIRKQKIDLEKSKVPPRTMGIEAKLHNL